MQITQPTRPKILIAGASGFIGQQLVAAWQNKYFITVLGRNREKLQRLFRDLTCLTWDNLNTVPPSDFDIVLNLTGETINHLRWTKKIKKQIMQSRLTASEKLVSWLLSKPNPALHFLQASALSIYGLYNQIPAIMNTETTQITPKPDFLCQVAYASEQTLQTLVEENYLVSILRFAVVLDLKSGAFPKLLMPAKFGLAARCGSGQQPLAWISLDDAMRAINYAIEQKIVGAMNLVAPEVITQNQFTQLLCKILKRPYFLHLPKWVVKLLFGSMGEELLIKGCSAQPMVLIQRGFQFDLATIDQFLQRTL